MSEAISGARIKGFFYCIVYLMFILYSALSILLIMITDFLRVQGLGKDKILPLFTSLCHQSALRYEALGFPEDEGSIYQLNFASRRGNQGETRWPCFILLVRRCPNVALHVVIGGVVIK